VDNCVRNPDARGATPVRRAMPLPDPSATCAIFLLPIKELQFPRPCTTTGDPAVRAATPRCA